MQRPPAHQPQEGPAIPAAIQSHATTAVTVGRKTYELEPKHLAEVKLAVAKAWLPIIRGLRANLAHTRRLWAMHQDLRENSILTATVVDAVARTRFPNEDLLKSADTAVTQLDQVVARGTFAAIPGAYDQAHAAVHKAASAIQDYHEAISDGGEDCVAALKLIRDASKFILEITADFATLGKPQLKAPMAAALGSYDELLTQIEAAQTSKTFDIRGAAVIVLAAGARDGFLKQLMSDGQVGRIFTEKAGATVAKALAKHCGANAATKILDRMFKSALEEGVKTALSDIIKRYSGGKALTLKEAAHHAIEDAAKKAGIAAFLGRFDKQLEDINDAVLRKVGSGAIKGLKVASPKAARELKILVEDTVGKLAVKFLDQNAANPAKLSAMDDAVAKSVLDDPAFKAALAKLAAQKAH